MKKRILALLTSIAMVLCLIPPAMAEASTDLGSTPVELDICDGSISIVSGTDTVTYSQGSSVYTSTGGCVVTQSDTSAPTTKRIDISAGSDACLEVKLTIAGLNIKTGNPIKLDGKAKVTLTLVAENTLSDSSGAGISVPKSTTLTIQGSGSVTAESGRVAAGIGGGYYGDCGTIVISSGTVTAIGGENGAGIGGGEYANGGTVIINGGTVIARGGNEGAGIGGGEEGNGGTVIINGGVVTATGGEYGAGIGGGSGGYSGGGNGGTITINGGTVTAKGGYKGAGIGGGIHGSGGKITINDGTVKATGSEYGVGIGGGSGGYSAGVSSYGGSGGSITISGGSVTASGIGGALDNRGTGTITITGGTVVSTNRIGGVGGTVSISNASVTVKAKYHAIGSGNSDNSYALSSIDIGENAILDLSITSSEGSLCQERIYIRSQGVDSAAIGGNAALFAVKADSYSGIQSYQWQVKKGSIWVRIEGQTSAVAFIPVTAETAGSSYRCAITNVYGNTVYTKEVKSYILAFTKQPESVETNLDEIAALTVTSSCSNVTYQWQRSYDGVSWADVAGKTSPTLVVTTTHSENGAWYRCVITATNGDQLASNPAQITVNTDAVTYSTDYYLEQADGSYVLVERVTTEGESGSTVTAPEKTFDYYTENPSKGKHSGTVAEDSSLVLSRYYDRCQYTLTFETDGGAAVAPITAKHGTAIELPADVSRYGYDFGGWYLDEELTEKAEFTVMPTEDTTVYAKWTAVGADRGTEYHINGITLLGSDYQEIDSVPEGSFYAHVSVTNLRSDHIDTLILATYDENGRMLDLYFLFADPQIGQTFSLGALIDNSDGEVAELRAFMIPLLGGPMIPLANSVSTNG